MTDMPSFGILCCGKDINELALSVKCCGRITAIMKNGGFILAGYHTAITQNDNPEGKKLCGEKLYHLAKNCDVLFTIGSDGFHKDDIIPDITVKLCRSEAVFFTSNLCGASHIGNYDKGKRSQISFCPSRSRAGILDSCLVLNMRNDMDFIDCTLPALLPSVSFAISGLTGKNVADSRIIMQSLRNICEKNANLKPIFLDNIQN
ncbi:MAG: hypothetical protein IKV97_03480 [Clostridia bacterium]|nr:hypothetical protein [Clostridia bacterium]